MTDFLEGLDGLQADMADHQRRFRGEVTASSNAQLAVETITRMEREAADVKPAPPPSAPEPIARTVERRDGQHGRYVVERGPDEPMLVRSANRMEHEWFIHAMPRVELLLTKLESGPLGSPSWHQRTMSVLKFQQDSIAYQQAGMHDAAAEHSARYVLELERLLDDSSQPFGDWRK